MSCGCIRYACAGLVGVCVRACVCLCACVCVREKEIEREKEREREWLPKGAACKEACKCLYHRDRLFSMGLLNRSNLN